MTYARARLWLGISCVGFWVLICAAGILLQAPPKFPLADVNFLLAQIVPLALYVMLYVAFSFPFDLLGGYILPRRYNKIPRGFLTYLEHWIRGAFVHALILYIAFVGILFIGVRLGKPGIVVFAAVYMFLLLLMQRWNALLMGSGFRQGSEAPSDVLELAEHRKVRLEVWDSPEPAFSAWWVGLPGFEKLIFPGRWLRALQMGPGKAEMLRKVSQKSSGARLRGVIVAYVFNMAGFVMIVGLIQSPYFMSAEIIYLSMYMTLWSFVGALALPSLSRPAVYAADAAAVKAGATVEDVMRAAEIIDGMQDDEQTRPKLVETIFHPTPSLQKRAERLENPRGAFGAHNANRLALYLSIGTLGLLSRAVHSNCGKTSLWSLFPSD